MNKYLIAAAVATISASAANAASVSFSDSISMRDTNWTESFTLSQFNSSLGTLTSVDFTLSGLVNGTASVQNLANEAVDPTVNLRAEITADFAGSELAVVIPAGSQEVNLGAFEGTFNVFDGGDAVEDLALAGTDTQTNGLFTNLAAFIGTGSINVNAAAVALSNVSGGGNANFITDFDTDASAEASITYNYDEAVAPIPLPAAGWALFAALGSLVAFRRYSRA